MWRSSAVEAVQTLEQASITFLYRPRVEQHHPQDRHDVQRVLLLLELHVPLPTPFPPSLQQHFRNRRFAQVDTTDWIDHPGAELVFVGASD